jgi:hypothetical protein
MVAGGNRRALVDPIRNFERVPLIDQVLYSRGLDFGVRAQLRQTDDDNASGQCPCPIHLSGEGGGGTDRWRTISVGGCLPTRSQASRSESDKPGAPSSAADRAVAGGCAADPCCRSAGTAHCLRS